jgi:hypothetical protein
MRGGVMPHCYGSVTSHADEYDLMHCTCNPNDPIVAHADLVGRTSILLSLLRERRTRRVRSGHLIKRLLALASSMKFAAMSAPPFKQKEAWAEAESLASQILGDMIQSSDAVDPHVGGSSE